MNARERALESTLRAIVKKIRAAYHCECLDSEKLLTDAEGALAMPSKDCVDVGDTIEVPNLGPRRVRRYDGQTAVTCDGWQSWEGRGSTKPAPRHKIEPGELFVVLGIDGEDDDRVCLRCAGVDPLLAKRSDRNRSES